MKIESFLLWLCVVETSILIINIVAQVKTKMRGEEIWNRLNEFEKEMKIVRSQLWTMHSDNVGLKLSKHGNDESVPLEKKE